MKLKKPAVIIILFLSILLLTNYMLTIENLVFYWALLGFVLSLLLLFNNPFWGLLLFVIIKPVIDMTWDIFILGQISLLHLSGIIPFILLSLLIIKKKVTISSNMKFSLFKLIFIYFLYITVHLLYVYGPLNTQITLNSFQGIMRFSNALSAFVLFPFLINKNENYNLFLITILISSFIPLIILILQMYGIFELRSSLSLGNIRYAGFFHGPVNQRHLFSISLICLFGKQICNHRISFFEILLGLILISGIFYGFSKAGTIFLISLPSIYLLTKFSIKRMIPFITLTIIVVYISLNIGYLENIFRKEIAVIQQTTDIDYALQGRVTIWKVFLENYYSESFLKQLFGSLNSGKVGFRGGIHNDYLLTLSNYGVIGLTIYILIILIMLKNAFFNFHKWIGVSPILDSKIFLTRAVTLIWLIDSMGLHPSMYPALLLFTFGVFGLAYHHINFLKSNETI